MRALVVLCFLLVASWATAQHRVQGIVADRKTRAILPLVHVFQRDTLLHTFTGTISDNDGRFSITVRRTPTNDSLEFSYLGYIKIKYSIATMLKTDTVFLSEEPVFLSPITVTPLSAGELMRTCITHIPENYRNTAFINTCFVWHAARADQHYESFQESIATLYEAHSTSHSRYQLLRDSVLSRLPVRAVPIIPPLDSIYKLLYFDFARAGSGILNAGTLREWTLRYAYDASMPERYWVVDAERKDHLQHARIYIDPDDYAFRKIEFGYRWKSPSRNRLNDTLYYSLHAVEGTLLYEKTGRHYGVKYITLGTRYTTGSTDLLKPRKPASEHHARIEYVVIESREVPASRRPSIPIGLHIPINPMPVDREGYHRIQEAIRLSKNEH